MPHSFVVLFLLILMPALNVCNAQTTTTSAPGQAPQQKQGPRILTWTPPEQTNPPFGSQIRKAVSEIRASCKNKDGKVDTYAGTGFIVVYHDPRLPAEQSFRYLVTNRHVAECLDDELKPMDVLAMSFQMTNTANGQTPTIVLNAHGNARWFLPDDDSVDLAVTPITLPTDINPVVIPMDLFFDQSDFKAQNIGEGAKIVFSGYFVQLEGSSKLQPLVREGVLSMIPDTQLTTTLKKPGRIYLGEVHVFGGNSGSPVFISTYGIRPNGPMLDDEFRFLGVVSGYYYEDSELRLQIAETVTGTQRANSGISMIVPADFVKDLIVNGKGVVADRDVYFKMQAVQAKK